MRYRINARYTISIHALLTESDAKSTVKSAPFLVFLSTLSLRRATWLRCWQLAARDISIHALLTESDHNRRSGHLPPTSISIHALLTESDYGFCEGGVSFEKFLSTLSLRRATNESGEDANDGRFLSTLSLRRATPIQANILKL